MDTVVFEEWNDIPHVLAIMKFIELFNEKGAAVVSGIRILSVPFLASV